MQISVIIPTYNRASILKKCLNALSDQTFGKENFEAIVADDGSSDQTSEIVKEFRTRIPNLIYLKQKKQGQGIARNSGIKHASGKIVILIGDDILVTPNFLVEHLKAHQDHPEENAAVLGLIKWHPELLITPFMKWLTNSSSILGKYGGHQFGYEKLQGKKTADYNFFYTSNLSLKKSLLQKYPFDPEFKKYGWEDIELGYRLTKEAGLKLYYHPQALAYHYHQMEEKNLVPRMRMIGQSAWIIQRKYPELLKVPPLWKQLIFGSFSNFLVLGILKIIKTISRNRICNFYYYAFSKKYFLQGLKKSSHSERK